MNFMLPHAGPLPKVQGDSAERPDSADRALLAGVVTPADLFFGRDKHTGLLDSLTHLIQKHGSSHSLNRTGFGGWVGHGHNLLPDTFQFVHRHKRVLRREMFQYKFLLLASGSRDDYIVFDFLMGQCVGVFL